MKMHKHSNCVKVQFEIGHEATLRAETTPQGFTHDWVVFVRGVENAEIHHFVEKVVFNLHESFHKPKRVIKEPPYEVRESGYASFAFPVEVYLKSKEEPRKLEFLYDLSLSINGPTNMAVTEKRFFNNPSEEFRRKLIRGGGVGVGSDFLPLTDNNSQNTDVKSSSKKSSSESKKHKSKDSLKGDERTTSQFADLFGTPIKTGKLSPTTTSKRSDSKHSVDKVSSKSITKHSPHKDKEVSKKDTLVSSSSKDKDKDRDRSKEKEKKLEKSLKRPPSPAATPPPAKTFKEEPKKSSHEETKEREKVKVSSSSEISKNEKKDKKKDKKNRDEKDKKDRHKDHDSKKEVAQIPPPQPVVEKEKTLEKTDKVKSEYKELKENFKKSPKTVVKEEKFKEKNDKEKTELVEKQRHKHKKKEKDKKEERDSKERERDKVSKKEKLPPAPPVVPKEPSPPPQPPLSKSRIRSPGSKNPLSALMLELPVSEKGSDTEPSSEDDAKSVEKVKMSPIPPPPPPAPSPPVARTPERVKDEKFSKEKVKKKDKKSSKEEDGSRKKKRRSKEKEEVVPEKVSKTKADEDQLVVREEPIGEDVDERLSDSSQKMSSPQREEQEVPRSRSPSPLKFTEEYVMELKDLQQKIMTLDDNAELQRVVQVIAETGQYEITKKTFDFDLCALDKGTVKRLQDLFFAAS